MSIEQADRIPGVPPALADDLPHPLWLKDERGAYRYVNRAFLRMVADYRSADSVPAREVIGKRDADLWSASLAASLRSLDQRARHFQGSQSVIQQIRFPDGTRWYEFQELPVAGEGRRRAGVGGVAVEVSHISSEVRSRLMEKQRGESQAAMRSFYALLRAAVRLGRDEPTDARTLSERVAGRIDAICFPMLQALGGEPAGVGGSLEDLVATLIDAERRQQVELHGRPIRAAGVNAQVLALVIHELLDASSRYAALRDPAGRVFLSWRSAGGGRVAFSWQEVSARPVVRAGVEAFELARQLIEYQLNGTFQATAGPYTLACNFMLDLPDSTEPGDQAEASGVEESASTAGSAAEGRSDDGDETLGEQRGDVGEQEPPPPWGGGGETEAQEGGEGSMDPCEDDEHPPFRLGPDPDEAH